MATRKQRVEALEAKTKSMPSPQNVEAGPIFDDKGLFERLKRDDRLRREGREAEIPPRPTVDPNHRFARALEAINKALEEHQKRCEAVRTHRRQSRK
jgi:hypothetical protein